MTHTLDLLILPRLDLGTLLVGLGRVSLVSGVACGIAWLLRRRPRTAATVLSWAGVAGLLAFASAALPTSVSPARLPLPRAGLPGGTLDRVLFLAWAVGAVGAILRAGAVRHARARLWSGAADPAPALHARLLASWDTPRPEIRMAPVAGAMVVRDGGPARVLVDPGVEALRPDELAAVVAHERDHTLHRDGAMRGLHTLLALVAWPSPFVHMARRCLVHAQEAAADRAALGTGIGPLPYALLLHRLATDAPAGVAAPAMGASALALRIRTLARHRGRHRVLEGVAAMLLLSVLLAAVSVRPHWRIELDGDPIVLPHAARPGPEG